MGLDDKYHQAQQKGGTKNRRVESLLVGSSFYVKEERGKRMGTKISGGKKKFVSCGR